MLNNNLAIYFSTCNHLSDAPFFACLVPRTSPLCLLLVCEEQPHALWSHCCCSHVLPPLSWSRPHGSDFYVGKHVPAVLLAGLGSATRQQTLALLYHSPFAAIWCSFSPWLPLEGLGLGHHTRELCPRAAERCSAPWQNPSPEPGASTETTSVLGFMGFSHPPWVIPSVLMLSKSHLHAASPQPPFRGQSFPMAGLIVCFQNIITCV